MSRSLLRKRAFRAIAVLTVVAVLGAGCGSQDTSCEGIANDTLSLMQNTIDELQDLSFEDADTPDDFVAGIDDLERESDLLRERADAAGCSNQEMERLVTSGYDQLTARTEFGRAILDSIVANGIFE